MPAAQWKLAIGGNGERQLVADVALLALVSDVDPSIEVPALAVRRLGGWVRDPARVLNTDELPALEFSAPRTERSGQLLTGPALRTFVTKHFQTGP